MERAAILAASRLIQAGTEGEKFSSWLKKDSTLVTSLDIDCDRIIRQELTGSYPILSEEDSSTHDLLRGDNSFFVIDPIDGTTACRRFLNVRGGQVGFGPLIGFVKDGVVICSTFYNVPHRTLYSAILGKGSYCVELDPLPSTLPSLLSRSKMNVDKTVPLESSVILFYVSAAGEAKVIEKLKTEGRIEAFARFGGFANDCSRLALGYEDLQLQFSVRPWDYPATLIAYEAGQTYIVDPLKQKVNYADWKLAWENPILGGSKKLVSEVLEVIAPV